MINILAVIISVALTTLMGAAGVFYLGTAFTTSGPKVSALQVIEGLSQVDASWILYSNASYTTTLGIPGAAVPTMTGLAGTTDLISGNFLSAVPTAPSMSVAFTTATIPATVGAFNLDLSNPADPKAVTTAAGALQNGGIFIVLPISAASVCLAIAQAGGMVPATAVVPLVAANPAGFATAFNTVKFGCLQLPNPATTFMFGNVAATANDNNRYVAYYKY